MSDFYAYLRGQALTAREIELLGLYMDGLGNQEIADKLVISVRTVETHRNKILGKLGAKTVAQAVRIHYDAKIRAAATAGVGY